ncbi:MAG TPA: hypothetical protein VGO91_09305 [Pyrinomonadaceae bacterium]|jgi:hypothetical protein|nr:hypothetical protein [Pyrinomonadaceae bacterium]
MMKRAKLLLLILVLLQCACSGGASVGNDNTTMVTMVPPPPINSAPVAAPSPPAGCATALSSARGSVLFGDKACSPDKMLYAREEEPEHAGRIGIYDRVTDRQLKIIKVTQQPDGDGPNEIKGLAWSPDSRLLAVMYHLRGGGSVSILDVKQGKETARLTLKGQPHLIEFSSQTKVKAGPEIIEIQ